MDRGQDDVIRDISAWKEFQKLNVKTNLSDEKEKYHIDYECPDIILVKKGIPEIVGFGEVETEADLVDQSADKWIRYKALADRLRIAFYLFVPKTRLNFVLNLASNQGLKLDNIQPYAYTGNKILIEKAP